MLFNFIRFLDSRKNMKTKEFVPSTYPEEFAKQMEDCAPQESTLHNTVTRARYIQNYHNMKRLLSFTLPIFKEELQAKTDVALRKIIRALSLFPSFLSGKSGHSDLALKDAGFKFTDCLKKLKEHSLEKFGSELEKELRIAKNGKDKGNLPDLTELELKNIKKVGKKLGVDVNSLFSKHIPKIEEPKLKTKKEVNNSHLPVVTMHIKQIIQIKEPLEEEQKVDYVDPFKGMNVEKIFIDPDTRHKIITGKDKEISQLTSYQTRVAFKAIHKSIKTLGFTSS
jgi:hypothetical protein